MVIMSEEELLFEQWIIRRLRESSTLTCFIRFLVIKCKLLGIITVKYSPWENLHEVFSTVMVFSLVVVKSFFDLL